MTAADLHLSPSAVHHHLMETQPPTLAYTGGDVAAWQRKLRRRLRQMLGPMPRRRCPLNVRTLWREETDLGSIEKLVFTSEPYADVPAYLCLPRGARPPYRVFICLQGHSEGVHVSIARQQQDERLPRPVAGDRDFALGCMRRGIAALCLEQRSFGMRKETAVKNGQGGCHDATLHALMLGRTLIGERVYDVDRGIDYLAARGDMRLDELGVMGNSGGGTISLFAAATLPRLRVAMPSCYFCTFRDSIMRIHHCMDNYVPGLLRVAEMADVMGLFAPRPVVIVAGQEDEIFPIAGVREAFAQLRRIYAAAGAPDNCRLVVGPEGHRFYADLGWGELFRLQGW
jgi:dienelactone hydrolase